MLTLVVQMLVLGVLVVAGVLWWKHFPWPSPWIRRWLAPRNRWPEAQIRQWLARGRIPAHFLDYFDRDPERIPPPGQDLLAPADGLVTSAECCGDIRYLVIALNFWDMHVQRSPLAGVVRDVRALGREYMDGEGRDFAFLRAKHCPVQQRLEIDGGQGVYAVRLITSLSARRIETWVGAGEHVERGQRIGRIRLGSTVVVEMPAGQALSVRIGQRVRAGETILARMPGAS